MSEGGSGRLRKVGEVLPKAMDDAEVIRTAKALACLRRWEEVVGPDLYQRSRPDKYGRGTVWVAVTGSAWAQELRFMKDLILERLRELAGDPRLFQEVRFGVRPIREDATLSPAGQKTDEKEATAEPSPLRELTIREIAERRLANWPDAELP